jgi:hypothetical protein
MRPRLSLTPSSKRYAIFVAISATVFGLIWANRQLFLEFQADSVRAAKMLRGEENVGSSRLQVPMLREGSFPKVAVQQRSMAKAADAAVAAIDLASFDLKNKNLSLSFAGMMPTSNNDVGNYILFSLQQKLIAAGATGVDIVYPVSTYRLGSDQATPGFANELDNVAMLTRDTQLVALSPKVENPIFLKIREAGVDTFDRSIYTPSFYIWAVVSSLVILLVVSITSYVLIERRWPGLRRLDAIVSTALGMAAGFNFLIWIIYSSPPNLSRFQVDSRISLSLSSMVNETFQVSDASAVDSVLVGGNQLDTPSALGTDKVFAPSEGGVYQVLPTPPSVIP